MLKRDEMGINERVILSLYNKRKYYIQNEKITPIIQENLFMFMETSKDYLILPVLINLICDISLYNEVCIRILRPDFDFYRFFLNPKNPEVSAATSRLILILSSNHILNPDQDESIKLISVGCCKAVAYITAAISTLFTEPLIYEDAPIQSASTCIFLDKNLPQLVKNTLKLFEKKCMNSSIASQHFASLILLKISESDAGLIELTKYIPMKPIIDTAIRFCPRTLGMKKQEGRIAIYLSRMIKNVWLYCEKSSNRDDLLRKFFAEISNFIFDVMECRVGFNRYSYLCTIQSIVIELADDILKQEKYRTMLMNPPFQEQLKLMKEERKAANEVKKLHKIDFLSNIYENTEQLTQDQILQIHEIMKENRKIREQLQEALQKLSESEKNNYQLKSQIEKMENIANNRCSNDDHKIQQLEQEASRLRSEINSKNNDIQNLNTNIKSKEDIINQISSQKSDVEKYFALSTSQDQNMISVKEAKIGANKQIFEQKTKPIEEKEKLEFQINRKESSDKVALSFDPFENEQKEEKNTNCFIGDEDNEHIKVIKKIGEGITSKTFKVFDSRTQQLMCKKVFKAVQKSAAFQCMQNAIKEFEVLRSLFHPCICRSIAINTYEIVNKNEEEEENENDEEENSNDEPREKTTIALYLEYLNYSLKDCLVKKLMDNTLKVKIVIEIVHAMNYLHKIGLMHRDLKVENIMMNSVFEAKLVDFGLVKIEEFLNQSTSELTYTKGVGTLAYMSPEMASEKDYDNKTDVYSFGIVLFYIFIGKLPKYSLEDKIHGKPLPLSKPSSLISQFCIDLITNCCKFNPADRPSFEEILCDIRKNSYLLAPKVNTSIVSKRDRELDFFETKYKI